MAASILYFKKLCKNTYPPEKLTNQSAGFDLHSAYNYKDVYKRQVCK